MTTLERLIDCLPQRPPFRFVDAVAEFAPLERAVGSVTFPTGHRVFDGHLPNDPIVPGVILIEALAQLSGICLLRDGESTARGFLGRDHPRGGRPRHNRHQRFMPIPRLRRQRDKNLPVGMGGNVFEI